MHCSSGDKLDFGGVVACGGSVAVTFTSWGALICGSNVSVFGCAKGFDSTTGFVVTSCAAGAQLIKNNNANTIHFIVETP
jgi:hypothetical protein